MAAAAKLLVNAMCCYKQNVPALIASVSQKTTLSAYGILRTI